MSEQTPENMSEREPSMEDILASIRKIIAEDAPATDGVAKAASGLDAALGNTGVLTRPGAAEVTPPYTEPEPFDLTANMGSDIDDSSTQDLLDMVEFDLTDDLAMGDEDIDISITDDVTAIPDVDLASSSDAPFDVMDSLLPDVSEADAAEDVLDLTDLADADAVSDDLEFDVDSLLADIDGDTEDTLVATVDHADTVETDAGELVTAGSESMDLDDDLDSLLDDLIADSELNTVPEVELEDITPDAETVFDPAADMIADDDEEDILASLGFDDLPEADAALDSGSALSEDDDIDLVKSLMADLTGDNASDFEPDSDDLVDVIIEDQVDDLAGLTATSDAVTDTDMEDLSAIIADINADAHDAEIRAQNVQDADILDLMLEDADLEGADDVIDAASVDQPSGAGRAALVTAAGAAIAAAGVSSVGKSDDAENEYDIDSDLEALLDDSEIIETEETENVAARVASPDPVESDNVNINEQQESDMSATTGREAISSRDTVDDTSSAFASLGKVVEEKAVFQESGPRIGDLVQDALKPMLQEWLDANLKQIVDRAVAKEIKRISSGK